MERAECTEKSSKAQAECNRLHFSIAESAAEKLWLSVAEAHRPDPSGWVQTVEEAIRVAVQAERDRWLSRTEGLRAKAREVVL